MKFWKTHVNNRTCANGKLFAKSEAQLESDAKLDEAMKLADRLKGATVANKPLVSDDELDIPAFLRSVFRI